MNNEDKSNEQEQPSGGKEQQSKRSIGERFAHARTAVGEKVGRIRAAFARTKASAPTISWGKDRADLDGLDAQLETLTAETESGLRHEGGEKERDYEAIWEIDGAPEDGKQRMYDVYDALLEDESRQPDDEDKYKISRRINEDSIEYKMLSQAGVSPEKIATGSLTRGELRSAGFVFVNTLAGGEKPLLGGSFPDPDDPSKTLDYTDRQLLTREELDKVYRYQQSEPQAFGLNGKTVEEVRQDMLLFLETATCRPPFTSQEDLEKSCLPISPTDSDWIVGTQEEHELVRDYLTWRAREIAKEIEARGGRTIKDKHLLVTAQDNFLDSNEVDVNRYDRTIVVEDAGGVGGSTRSTRNRNTARRPTRRGINGTPSPFLDQGFVFTSNHDILVETSGLHRLNMVNVHLLGGHPDYQGLSEMGKTDWDQSYMSPGEYMSNIYPRSHEERTWSNALQTIAPSTRETILRTVQAKIIEVAKAKRAEIPSDLAPLDLNPTSSLPPIRKEEPWSW